MKTPWPFLLAFALSFYSTGATFIESFVNYPSWRLIGANEFVAYHRFITPRVVAFLVVPRLLAWFATMIMLRYRPAAIPGWAVWIAVVLQAIVWVSSATIQIPMQGQFSANGFSEERLAWLMASNFWLRRIPSGVAVLLFLWMMHRVLADAQRPPAITETQAPEPTPSSLAQR